jgi:hypothetical protein
MNLSVPGGLRYNQTVIRSGAQTERRAMPGRCGFAWRRTRTGRFAFRVHLDPCPMYAAETGL